MTVWSINRYPRLRLSDQVTTFPTLGGSFLTTHWSIVDDSGRENAAPERAEAALARLCQDYWPPLYRFIRRRGYSETDAKDLTQGFFAYLIEKQAYAASDRTKGRFRTFLLMLLKRYLSAVRAGELRQKRGGACRMVFLDQLEIGALEKFAEKGLWIEAPLNEERQFERNWALALVHRAMQALEAEYSSRPKARIIEELRPFLAGGVGLPTQEEVAARLNIPLETLRSHLSRLRASYRARLRAEVLRTVAAEPEIDEELRYLCRILIARA